MDPRVTKSIITSTQNIFKTMVLLPLQEGEPYQPKEPLARYDYTGVIGLSGPAAGAVNVHFSKKIAAQIASSMLGSACDEHSTEVRETVGELTNMVAGGMRNELSNQGINFDISLPTVVSGDQHSTDIRVDTPTIAVPFNVNGLEFVVEASLKLK